MNKLENWKRLAEQGTSGDMVWDILKDWETEVNEVLQALEPIAYQDCDSWGCCADSHRELGCPPEIARKIFSARGRHL